jgi:hypothetical protein
MTELNKKNNLFARMFGSKRIFLQQEEKKQEIVVVLQKPKESESEPPISNRKEVFG